MIESAGGIVERLFERLIADDWAGYGELLSADVERIRPWGGGLSQFEETLVLVMDDEDLVSRIEVFWQTPWMAPPGRGSTANEDG